MAALPTAYSFRCFRLLPSERLLLRDDEPVPTEPRVFDALHLLVSRSGQLVEKEELMRALWPDTFVTENNLNKAISEARKLLAGGARGNGQESRYIETVIKRGYRFVAPVVMSGPGTATRQVERALSGNPAANIHTLLSVESAQDSVVPRDLPGTLKQNLPPRWTEWILRPAAIVLALIVGSLALLSLSGYRTRGSATRPAGISEIRSLAVLPFRRLDGSPANNYLGLAIADAVIDRLGYAQRFSVRPTSSVISYGRSSKDAMTVGRELGVDGIIEGSIQTSGGRTRVTVQLVSVAGRQPIWSARFDDPTADAFELEDLVGGAVARALSSDVGTVTSAPRHRPARDAYDAYIQGRYYLSQRSPDDIAKALGSFQDALVRDRRFAAAYAGLAETEIMLSLYHMRTPEDAFPKAKAAAAQALELEPQLAEAHGCLGATAFYYDHDAINADRELRRAIELKPGFGTGRRWYANFLTATARFDDAVRQIRIAQRADPQSLMLRSVLGWELFMARRYDEAIRELRLTLDIDNSFVPALHTLALAYMYTNHFDEAVALFQKESAIAGHSYMVADMARLDARRGDRPGATQWLKLAENEARQKKVAQYDLASMYAEMGDPVRARTAMTEAIDTREGGIVWMQVDPRLDKLRRDPALHEAFQRLSW